MNRTRVRDAIALYPATAPLGAADTSRDARVFLRTSSSLVALVVVLVIILIFG